MEWILIGLNIALRFIPIVEKLFGSGTGAQKKEAVLSASQAAIETVTSLSTGGQKETWNTYGPIIGEFIDNTVESLNKVGAFDQFEVNKMDAGA